MISAIRLILLFLLAGSAALRADSFAEGNAAYASGDFAKAEALYTESLRADGPDSSRFFNLGNAQAARQRFGPAILAYERAAFLDPRDAGVQGNLRLTRQAAQRAAPGALPDSPVPPPWWKLPLTWLSLHEWSAVTGGGLILLTLTSLLWGWRSLALTWLRHRLPIWLGLGLTMTATGTLALQVRKGEMQLAIATANKPVLRLSPFATAAETAVLAPGQRLIPGETQGEWAYVSLPGGETRGWLPVGDFEEVVKD